MTFYNLYDISYSLLGLLVLINFVTQLVGVITDFAIETPSIIEFASSLALTPEQFGMRLGILVATIFPLLAVFVYSAFLKKGSRKASAKETE